MIVGTSVGWCGSCGTPVVARTEQLASCTCGTSTLRYGHGNGAIVPKQRPKLRLIKGDKT